MHPKEKYATVRAGLKWAPDRRPKGEWMMIKVPPATMAPMSADLASQDNSRFATAELRP
jgi:hypothetical protein